jgi:hypothetical protein
MAEENKGIEELLGSEENLQKAIAIIKEKGNVVMPQVDFDTKESNIRKEVGSHFAVKLSLIDETLKDLGFEKESNEPTEKFSERISKVLKQENDTLKKQREEGLTGEEGLKLERDDLLKKLNASAQEKEELVKGFETTLTNKDKEFLVNKAISKLTFKEGIESVLTPAKNQFIENILKESTLEEGKLVFKDKDGVTKRNDKNDPLTVLEMATKQFESVLSTEQGKTGLGNGDNTNKNSKSSLSLFAASRVPTNFGEMEATIKAFYLQQGKTIVNGGKEMMQGIKELKKLYNI